MLRFAHWKLLTAVGTVIVLIAVALAIAQDQDALRIRAPLATDDPRFPGYLAQILGRPLLPDTRFVVYSDGASAYEAMLQRIRGARRRISFETYIFDAGSTGDQFVTALTEAARRGVQVRMVLDSVGAGTLKGAAVERLEGAGVRIGWFNEVRSYSIEEANYRTHRKILVIDGEAAFVGGMGVADHWAFDTADGPRWRDTQVEVRGRAAAALEGGFYENWIETGGLVEPEVVPASAPVPDGAPTLVVWSSPEGGTNGMKLLYLLAIASARRTLDIQSPYLITDESTLWSLQEARRRGVRVRLLMEGDLTDARPVKASSRSGYADLLAIGAELFEYQPAMMHTKALVADGMLSIVGSANFDNRSLELNDEINVGAFDSALAARLTRDFTTDLGRARRIDPAAWPHRPWRERVVEEFWGYFGEIF